MLTSAPVSNSCFHTHASTIIRIHLHLPHCPDLAFSIGARPLGGMSLNFLCNCEISINREPRLNICHILSGLPYSSTMS